MGSADSEPGLPLSVAQHDYLRLGRKGYGAVPVYSKVTGPLRFEALADATRHVIARHEPLRMRLNSDGASQVFLAPELVSPQWHTASLTDRADLDHYLTAHLDRERDGALQLMLLPETAEQTHVLALVDHLACDGWSVQVFLRELWSAYSQIIKGETVSLPPIARQYSDYVRSQQARTRPSEAARRYWETWVDGFARYPTGLWPQGDAGEGAGRADVVTTVAPDAVRRTAEVARLLQVSPNLLPLGSMVLAAWSMAATGPGSDTVGVSFVYSGRDVPGVQPLIGVFQRHVAVLVTEITSGTVADFFKRLSRTVLDSLRFSRAPFSARDFNAQVAARREKPVVDVLYNQIPALFGQPRSSTPLQVDEHTNVQFAGVHFSPSRWRSYQEPRLRMTVGGGDQPNVQAIFNEGLLPEEQARCFVERTVAILEALNVGVTDHQVARFVDSTLSSP